MELFRFIDSKDIREHLRQIDYPFTAPEAAFLVWRCRSAALEEKFGAWQTIIETMPDASLTRRETEPLGGCHDFLRRHIASQKALLQEFPNGTNCVYRYETHEPPRPGWPEDDGWRGGGAYFDRFASCLSHCLRQLDGDTQTDALRFYRQEWCGADGEEGIQWILETDRAQNPVRVDRWGSPGGDELTETDRAFSDWWLAFPTPFGRGDLVWAPSQGEAPFVLDYLNVWDTREMLRQGFSLDGVYAKLVRNADRRVQAYRRTGCTMDMGAYGYAWREGFGLWEEFGGWANYLDLEFYPFELEGKDRALRPVSEFLKRNCDLELLLNSYTALLLGAVHDGQSQHYRREYVKEALQTVGLAPKQESRERAT